MKTLLITLLLSISIFGQAGGGSRKSVLTQAQKDSIGAMIRDSSGYVRPETFGATIDDDIDDSGALQATIDYAIANDFQRIKLKKGVYNVASGVFGDFSNLTIEGEGYGTVIKILGTLACSGCNGDASVLSSTGTRTLLSSLAVDGTKGDSVIILTGGAGDNLSNGDLIQIMSSAKYGGGSNIQGELRQVVRVDGDTLLLVGEQRSSGSQFGGDGTANSYASGLWDTYLTSDAALVYKITPIENVTFKNFTIDQSDSSKYATGIQVRYGKNITVQNVRFNRLTGSGLNLATVYVGNVENCFFDYSINTQGNSYGVAINMGSSFIKVTDSFFNSYKNGVAHVSNYSGGVSRFSLISNNHFNNCTVGVDAHQGHADFITVDNNMFSNCGIGRIFSNHQIISNNQVYGVPDLVWGLAENLTLLYFDTQQGFISVHNNIFQDIPMAIVTSLGVGTHANNEGYLSIKDNFIGNARSYPVYVYNSSQEYKYKTIQISGNIISSDGIGKWNYISGIILHNIGAHNISISDNFIDNNSLTGIAVSPVHTKNITNTIISNNTITNCGYGIGVSGQNIIVSGNQINLNPLVVGNGITIGDSTDATISNNVISNTGNGIYPITPSTLNIVSNVIKNVANGIYAADSVMLNFTNNTITTATMGIYISQNSTVNITGNSFTDVTTKIVNVPTYGQIKNNLGYITSNSGTSIMYATTNKDTVTHGLSITPDIKNITVTPQNAIIGNWFISDVNATRFYINTDSTQTSNKNFSWQIKD